MHSEDFDDKYVKLGTGYGGWYVPRQSDFDENSVVYGVGVGEDISFDLNIHKRYKCNVVLIDPTEKAKRRRHTSSKKYCIILDEVRRNRIHSAAKDCVIA